MARQVVANATWFESLFWNSLDPVVLIDLEANLLEVNPAFLDLLGYDKGESISGSVLSLLDQTQLQRATELLKEVKSTGNISRPEKFKLRRKDGSSIWAECTATLVYRKGHPVAILGMGRQILAPEELKERLQQLAPYIGSLIERLPIGLIVWDTEFKVQLWNPAAEKILGYNQEEALNKHPYELIVPKEVQPRVNEVWALLLQGDMTAHSINENITREGKIITCYWTNTPLFGLDGKVIGVLSLCQDITQT